MKQIYYKSVEGVIVNLISTPYKMLSETGLLNNEWEPITVGENNPRINKLKKKMVSPPFKIRITGDTKAEMLENLEHIEGVFDRDCFLFETTKQTGKLYIGDFYRECIITSSTKEKVFERTGTTVEYIATSNKGFWKNNKEIIFSGSGALMGEIADKVFVSSSYNNQDINVVPLENHQAHIKWGGTPYSSGSNHWFQIDMGSVMDIESISGLKLKRQSVPPLTVDVQTSDGTTVDDARTISATALQETAQISIFDFTEITVDDFGESGWDAPSLKMICYNNNEVTDEIWVVGNSADILGEPIDVSAYDYVSFLVGYLSGTTTVDYTVNEQQWTTVDTITVGQGSEVEIEVGDISCRYLRLIGDYFGQGFDEDLSVVSGETISPRNLLDLGYSTENVLVNKYEGDRIEFDIPDMTNPNSYVIFDDNELTLKSISCDHVDGVIVVQGENDGVWETITYLTDDMAETYDTHYDRIRLKIEHESSVHWTHLLSIMVETDAKVFNDSYAPSEAIIEISGIQNNPSIMIGNVEYGATLELAENHILKIDTENKTVQDYDTATDNYENVFNERTEDAFEKIETGENVVTWGGNANIKIILEQARSTPKWN